MNKIIYALSGFLGQVSDWDTYPQLIPIDDLVEPLKKYTCLLGYSMGGRRVLQHLVRYPEHYRCAIIISAHPGLQSESERQIRAESDAQWASRFLSDPWNDLMHDWNRQSIFTDVPNRQEHHYSRQRLSDELLKFSLARQPDLREPIASLQIPILWITGVRDTKFTALAQSVQLSHPMSKKIVAPDAGHRVPWENAIFFRQSLEQFIGETHDNASCTSISMDNHQNLPRH